MFRRRWSPLDLPEQRGRVAVVTGANSGLGLETARALAALGFRVVLAVRDRERGKAAARAIARGVQGADLRVAKLDLASLASVVRFADRLLARESRLDLLVNNAGVMAVPYGRTADGFERHLGINHLGHFALTAALFDLLAATPGARVVTVSSLAHRVGALDFADLHWQRRRYRRMQAYADSKLANLLFAFELARRLAASEYLLLSVAAHPGWSATRLQRHLPWLRIANPLLGQSPARGALPVLRAALDPEAGNGAYYGPEGIGELWGAPRPVAAHRRAHDPETARRLWEVSEQLTGLRFPL
ncbi:MAG: short-chain dehydrogenase [Porticoccaceae bacterium]|nr:MAG: short-chain dehydrogenase [Porticoccaceae bacterium]